MILKREPPRGNLPYAVDEAHARGAGAINGAHDEARPSRAKRRVRQRLPRAMA